jgi:hypothetical protein
VRAKNGGGGGEGWEGGCRHTKQYIIRSDFRPNFPGCWGGRSKKKGVPGRFFGLGGSFLAHFRAFFRFGP